MEPEERLIPLAQIRDPEWNSRTTVDPAKIKSLGETIKKQGQLQSIKVEQLGPEDYVLVFGSRRRAAMTAAGFIEIRAQVYPPSTSTQRMLENALENVQREDLTTFELARTCASLREKGLSLEEVADATGLSKPYISNLVVTFNGLAGSILADWQAGDQAATVSYLRELVKIKGKKVTAGEDQGMANHEAQFAVWTAHKANYEAAMADLFDDDEEEDNTPEEKEKAAKKSYTIKAERYKALMKALKASKAPTLAVNVARYLVGEIEEIKGLIELPPEPETEDKPKSNKKEKK